MKRGSRRRDEEGLLGDAEVSLEEDVSSLERGFWEYDSPEESERKFLLTTDWVEEFKRSEKPSKISVYGRVTGSYPLRESHGVDAVLESLDYDLGSSILRTEHDQSSTLSAADLFPILLRWILLLFIGILPALVATGINLAIQILSNMKFSFLRQLMDHYFIRGSMLIPFGLWILFNWIPGAIAGSLVVFGEPQAAGSGIPQIKAYLNGIAVPRLMRLKTLFAKSVGVVFSVVAGLAVGKEGPMIHSGAAIAAGICQGKSSSLGLDFIVNSRFYKAFSHYRNDGEKRDFVACGAAAGVAAAFGAPFGGVLFALEEGNSHFDPYLMWKLTFTSTTSYFTLNIIKSVLTGVPGKLSSGGLINFGKFKNACYGVETFPVLILIGVIGGLLGALYVQLNKLYTIVRLYYFQNRFVKVLDVIYIAGLGAAIGSAMFLLWTDCIDLPTQRERYSHPLQLSCPGGQYHVMANLWFATPEDVVRALLHSDPDLYAISTLLVFGMCYFLLAVATYGLSVSSGVFVPSILIGCTWGRALGIFLIKYVTFVDWGDDVGKFALFGAAAQLSGNVRMMVSLTLIIIESTGNLTYSFPIVIVCMVAKYTGDFFNEGLYETHSELNGVPYLPWQPSSNARLLIARDIMTTPLCVFQKENSLEYVWNVLRLTPHNGFPVVEKNEMSSSGYGKFKGIILRDQILTMLHYGQFRSENSEVEECMTWENLRSLYPRFPKEPSLNFTIEELRTKIVKISKVMNHSPYTVNGDMSVDNVYRLFRLVGLRHLVVINDDGEAVGIITRQNLAKIHEGGIKQVFIPKNESNVKDVGPEIQKKFKIN